MAPELIQHRHRHGPSPGWVDGYCPSGPACHLAYFHGGPTSVEWRVHPAYWDAWGWLEW